MTTLPRQLTIADFRRAYRLAVAAKDSRDHLERQLLTNEIREIFEEPVCGFAMSPAGIQEVFTSIGRCFGQIRKCLSIEDLVYIAKFSPSAVHDLLYARRRLLWAYADTLSRDVEILWLAKCAVAEIERRDLRMLLFWHWQVRWQITELRCCAMLLGLEIGRRQIGRVAESLEELLGSTCREVAPMVEALVNL